MVLGIVIVGLLLIALRNCLDLQNPVTTVYAGKTSNNIYYINSGNTSINPVVTTSCGNVFNDTNVNMALNSIDATFEEEYFAYKCIGESRYSKFISSKIA